MSRLTPLQRRCLVHAGQGHWTTFFKTGSLRTKGSLLRRGYLAFEEDEYRITRAGWLWLAEQYPLMSLPDMPATVREELAERARQFDQIADAALARLRSKK